MSSTAGDDIFAKVSVQQGINFDQYDKIPVTITGQNIPPALESFETEGIPSFIRNNIRRIGYKRPTPIQRHTIPISLSGRDLLSCAQTGSGKTAAFLVPAISRIFVRGRNVRAPSRMPTPSILVLSPTRELARQIQCEADKFVYGSGIKVGCVYGGMSFQEVTQELNGCDLLIGCPGRVNDLVERRQLSLNNIHVAILDEADRMLDMGFSEQMNFIMSHMPAPYNPEHPYAICRQTLMFSATFPPAIRSIAATYLAAEHVHVTVGVVGSTTANIAQRLHHVHTESDRRTALLTLLHENIDSGLQLIFVNQKRAAENLFEFLEDNGYECTTIHGDLTQDNREANLAIFRSQEVRILIATDVAQRGLDIPDVKHVINYNLPRSIDDYTHRIGRTGRCGNVGLATSLVSLSEDRQLIPDLIKRLNEGKSEVPAWLTETSRGNRGANRGGRGGRGGASGVAHAPAPAPAAAAPAAAAADGWGW